MEKARKTPEAQSIVESPIASDKTEVFQLRISRNRGLLFTVAVFAVLVGIGVAGFWLGESLPVARASVGGESSIEKSLRDIISSNVQTVAEGPWGELEYQLTTLEPPQECLLVSAGKTFETKWIFKGLAPGQVMQLLGEAKLSQAERQAVCNAKQWKVNPEGVTITPTFETVAALSPGSRRTLYAYLGQFAENGAQHEPFYWAKTQDAALFENAPQVSAATRALVKRLSYPHGKLMLFADLPAVLSQISTQPERVACERALSRQPAVFVKLVITPETDVDSLIHYWGVGGSGKYAEPGLEALTKLPEGRKASIFSVLPLFAREHLYVFPSASDPGPQDGMWTAFNFFKDHAQAPTQDGAVWKQMLQREYYPVFSDPRFGDVVILTSADGQVVQTCVYLADNLVFAKTSARISTPWAIMRLADVQMAASAALPEDATPLIAYYRNKSV